MTNRVTNCAVYHNLWLLSKFPAHIFKSPQRWVHGLVVRLSILSLVRQQKQQDNAILELACDLPNTCNVQDCMDYSIGDVLG